MRCLTLCTFVGFLFCSTDLTAQTVSGTASGISHGGVTTGRGGVSADSQLRGRGSVTVPSRGLSDSPRTVGPNFDVRGGAQFGADVSASRRARIAASLDASTQAQRDARARDQHAQASHRDAQHDHASARGFADVNRHILHADLQLAHRLAEIDRLRDHALAHDDLQLLMRADYLEQQARLQHQRHVSHMQFQMERHPHYQRDQMTMPAWDARAQAAADAAGQFRHPYGDAQVTRPVDVYGNAFGPPSNGFGVTGQIHGELQGEAAYEDERFDGGRSLRRYSVMPAGDAEASASGDVSSAANTRPGYRPNIDAEGQVDIRGEVEAEAAPRPSVRRARDAAPQRNN